jgi:hypothetical protein
MAMLSFVADEAVDANARGGGISYDAFHGSVIGLCRTIRISGIELLIQREQGSFFFEFSKVALDGAGQLFCKEA